MQKYRQIILCGELFRRINIYMFPFLLWIKCSNTQYINFLTGYCPRPSSQSTLSASLISCLCISLSLSYFLLFSQIPRSDPWIAAQNKNLVPTGFFALCFILVWEFNMCIWCVLIKSTPHISFPNIYFL